MLMTNPAKFEIDPDDSLPILEVGPWVKRKHEIIRHYVGITSAVRRNRFNGNAAFVDLYCGPGRARIKDTSDIVDGSAVVAWKAAKESNSPFNKILVSDVVAEFVDACRARLPDPALQAFAGDAAVSARKMLDCLDPHAFTIVLIDPFDLKGLRFEIIEAFSRLKHVDFIVHFSTMEIQRNIDRYFAAGNSSLDAIDPDWRDEIKGLMTNEEKLRVVFNSWKRKIGTLGFEVGADPEAIINSKNRWLYWLALASRHPLAADFWGKISRLGPQGNLF